MSTIKFHTRLKAKALIFISFFYLCFGESIDFSKITNLTIQEPKFLDSNDSQKWKVLCKQWTFSQEKLKVFFKISNYEEHNPYEMFYQAPCEIWGSFTYKEKKCVFVVNGGGVTEISCDNKEPFWLGCSNQECKYYVLIPYDGLEGQ